MKTLAERAAELVTIDPIGLDDFHDVRIDGNWIDGFASLDGDEGANAWVAKIRAVFVRELREARRLALLEAAEFVKSQADYYGQKTVAELGNAIIEQGEQEKR